MKGILLLVAMTALVMVTSTAQAQPPSSYPGQTPTVSPYLNLRRGANDPAINYYGIVRPQVDFRRSLQNLQQELQSPNSTGNQGPESLTTGHPVRFQNYSHYFGRSLTGGPAVSPMPGPAAAPAPPYSGGRAPAIR